MRLQFLTVRNNDLDKACIYWHRELPPIDAELTGEYVLEATSDRVRGSLAHRGELWDRAYHELMERTETRLKQEIGRLAATTLTFCVNPSTVGTTMRQVKRLHGLFTHVLYRPPKL